jgi:hypothetical protein
MRGTMSRGCGVYALVVLAACSSRQPPVGGGGIETPPPQASAGLVDGGADASADGGRRVEQGLINNRPPPDDRPYSQIAEEDFGLTLTDKDKLTLDACPRRVWSTDVPDRDCKKDSECGEGYCDRGHCQPIYTCGPNMGNPCSESRYCRGICFEGRCRSCISDEECDKKAREMAPNVQSTSHLVCGRRDAYDQGRHCLGG